MGSARSISLYLTLGIAAVDMLCCAFISSILLFVMFLLPENSASGGIPGSERLLAVQWVIGSHKAVLSLTLKPPDAEPVVVWSNDPDGLDPASGVCGNLSKKGTAPNACRLLISSNQDSADGILIIDSPRSGKWDIVIAFGDSWKQMNLPAAPEVNVDVTVIGGDTITATLSGLKPLERRELRTAAKGRNSESAINSALDVE